MAPGSGVTMNRRPALILCAIAAGLLLSAEACYECESGFFLTPTCNKRSDVLRSCFPDREVSFRKPFLQPPAVIVGLTAYHYKKDQNGRMTVRCMEVKKDVFTLRAKTWESTYLHYLNTSYMACGMRA